MPKTAKTRSGRVLILPTPEEDAAITRAAMSDPDAMPFDKSDCVVFKHEHKYGLVFSWNPEPRKIPSELSQLHPEQPVSHRYHPYYVYGGEISCSAAQLTAVIGSQIERQKRGHYTPLEIATILANEKNFDRHTLLMRFTRAASIFKNQLVVRDPKTGGAPIDAESVTCYEGEPLELAKSKTRLFIDSWVFPEDVNKLLDSWGVAYRFEWPRPWSVTATNTSAQPDTATKTKSASDWKPLAQKQAKEYIAAQKLKDLYPSQENISEWVAPILREKSIFGVDGKPLTAAYIKRHALKGISSAVYKQLSTINTQGK